MRTGTNFIAGNLKVTLGLLDRDLVVQTPIETTAPSQKSVSAGGIPKPRIAAKSCRADPAAFMIHFKTDLEKPHPVVLSIVF